MLGRNDHNIRNALSGNLPTIRWSIVPKDTDETIYSFRGPNYYLSNFYNSPIEYHDIYWPTAEHLFQASRCELEKDRKRILLCKQAFEAKRVGKETVLRSDYSDELSFGIMLNIVRMKFIQNAKLMQKLVNLPQKTLIEGNYWHDNKWGKCFCSSCKTRHGSNLFGIILSSVKQEILDENIEVDEYINILYQEDQI